uniref:Uncharacterized protein n=1 Tax=Avena sativa TaxID=4498 RepID=A0ACD5T7A1_AVESA
MAPTAQTVMSSPKVGAGSIASRWQELQGSDSWTGLLDPLDADLRASLIAYGELAEAAYDGFNADERSPNAGSCMYTCAGLLAASGVSHPEYYTVTKFLFATCDLQNSPASMSVSKALFLPQREGPSWRQTNWIGYVAVATDEGKAALGRRDIVVVWRGTVEVMEHIHAKDTGFASAAQVLHLSPGDSFADARVHAGLLSVYTTNNPPENHHVWLWTLIVLLMTSARDQALTEVARLVEAHKDEVISITVTGHSLGASLATLNAVDMVASGVNVPPHTSSEQQRPCPVTAILFASPLVGDGTFRSAFASFPDLRALHVKNLGDTVLEHPPQDLGYADVATATLPIDTSRSPYLRPHIALLDKERKEEIVRRHNLECYLHCLAGDHGDDKDFQMVVERDVALVNKGAHALKDEYPAVPANWWAINHKRKVKGVVGRWAFENFKDVDEQSSG